MFVFASLAFIHFTTEKDLTDSDCFNVALFTQCPNSYEMKPEVCTIPFIEINWGKIQDFTRRDNGG